MREAASRPGGQLILKDFFLDEDRKRPRGGAIFAVNMLVSTDEGDCYTITEARSWLQAAGLELERSPRCGLQIASARGVEAVPRVDGSSGRSLRSPGDSLDLFPDPQRIATEDLADLLVGVAALEQDPDQVGQVGDVFETGRCRRTDAVEVRADTDVFHAHQPHHMIDVIGDIRDIGQDRRTLLQTAARDSPRVARRSCFRPCSSA